MENAYCIPEYFKLRHYLSVRSHDHYADIGMVCIMPSAGLWRGSAGIRSLPGLSGRHVGTKYANLRSIHWKQ